MSADGRRTAPLVDRDGERAAIDAAMERASEGRGELLLLTGEAGTGKTAVAEAAAARARARGHLVLWGQAWDGGGAPAYWLWHQALRGLVGAPEGPSTLVLASLAPPPGAEQLAEGAGPSPDGPARFRLFEAVRATLAEVAADSPGLLVLDDVHAADTASLELLRFLAQELRGLPILVIATYRPLVAKQDAEVDRCLAAVARDARRLPLAALGRDGVQAVLAEAGVAADRTLARRVLEATGGNPRLVTELASGLGAAPDPFASLPLPDGLRAAIRRGLEPLDDRGVELLGAASVLGTEFELSRLRTLVGWERRELLEALGACRDVGAIAEVPERPGRYRFRHAIVPQMLLADLPEGDRAALHLRAAAIIEQRHAADLDPHLDDLARHYHAGAPDDVERALEISIHAAERAQGRLDLERAADLWRDAVDLAERSGVDRTRRCDLLLALGEAQSRAGGNALARTSFIEATRVARSDGDWQRFARAALGAGGTAITPTAGILDATLVKLLREALARLDASELVLRATLLGRLAMERYYADPWEVRDAMTREAVDLAERSGDAATLGRALNARHYALWSLDDVEARLANATEILAIARRANDTELALQARTWRLIAYLELGDAAAVDREIAVHARLAAASSQPYHLWSVEVFRGMRALLEGRFPDAERHSADALEIGAWQDTSAQGVAMGPNARMVHGVQLFNMRREQGRLPELEDHITGFSRRYPNLPVWRCAAALVHLQAGRADEARDAVDRLAATGFADLPRDGNWLVAITLLAEVVGAVGDADRARELHGLLTPYAGRVVVVGQGAACRGAVDLYLGLLAAAAGEHERAAGHLESALVTHDRLGARPFGMRTRLALARSLRALGTRGAEATELLREAQQTGHELGLAGPVQQAEQALATGGRVITQPAPDQRAQTQAQLVRGDGRWTFRFEGRVTQLRDAKGLRYLASLLAEPGVDHPSAALEQEASGRPPPDRGAARLRFAELRVDLAEAERDGDEARLSAARESMAELAAALTADHGEGRAEQARVNVTRAIRTALRNVADADAALGAHLEHAVRTGLSCAYRPDPLAPITWTVELDAQAAW